MCGIAGIISFRDSLPSKPNIKVMLDQISYRGPDQERIWVGDNVTFGFRRLAIIDLSEKAMQPMANDDGQIVIVFNGEIYNYIELKDELTKGGYKFKTRSDTEVLIKTYEKYGIGFLNKLNGMFAFAILDRRRNELFMARDRSGKKPFHYYFDGQKLIFASELKAILADNTVPRTINPTGLGQYLALGYIISPETIYKNIFKLKPAHYIKVSIDRIPCEINQSPYWDIKFQEDHNRHRNISGWADEFRELFRDAVRIRMKSDVPYGIFLSGGLDASAVAITATEVTKGNVDAFTVNFENPEMSELATAQQLVAKYGKIRHHVLNTTAEDLIQQIGLLDNLDEPFSDSSFLPTYWISKLVKEQGITVALSGDGGDELLAGYYSENKFSRYNAWFKFGRYMRPLINGTYRALAKENINWPFLSTLERCSLAQDAFYWSYQRLLTYAKFKGIFEKHFLDYIDYKNILNVLPKRVDAEDIMNKFEFNDFKYRLADGYLAKVDRASMLNSLEVRSPFLDYRIIELLTKLPKQYKLKGSVTKVLMRHAFNKQYPQAVLSQRKMGFSVPLRDWLLGNLKDDVLDAVHNSILKGMLKQNSLLSLWGGMQATRYQHNIFTETAWRIYILARYLNNWSIKKFYI